MKDLEGVETTQPSDDDRFFTDEEITDEMGEIDETVEPDDDVADETEDEPEAQPEKSKFTGKTAEEILDMYKNLEAAMGKQAQELGELRKATAPKDDAVTPAPRLKDILTGSDTQLADAIAKYEEYLATPNQHIDDSENYGAYNVQYNQLLNERTARTIMARANQKATTEAAATIAHRYKTEKNLSEAEIAEIKTYAETKLSDTGEITASDLDVAMHKLYPDKWNKSTIDKVKKQIAEAKTQVTARISGGTSTAGATGISKSAAEFLKMSEDDQDTYLDSISTEDAMQLREKINKG